MIISNSLPFSIVFRCWQLPQENDEYDQMERDKKAMTNDSESFDESNERDNISSVKSSELKKNTELNSTISFSASDCINMAENNLLNGMDMGQPMFIQVAQSSAAVHLKDQAILSWSSPGMILSPNDITLCSSSDFYLMQFK